MEKVDPKEKLKPFEALIGEWTVEMTHPLLPDTVVHGRCTYESLEGGSLSAAPQRSATTARRSQASTN